MSSDVDAYLAAAPEARREALAAIRELCRTELAGFSEEIAHGMPSYRRDGDDGEIEVAFASQRQYISLYVMRTDVIAQHADRLAGIDRGKGCIRYRRPQQIDLHLVRSMLRATAQPGGPVC